MEYESDTAGSQKLTEDGQQESEIEGGPGPDEDEEQGDDGEGGEEGGDDSDMDEGEKAYWAQKAKAGKRVKVSIQVSGYVCLFDQYCLNTAKEEKPSHA